jgi:transposase InsO family protein
MRSRQKGLSQETAAAKAGISVRSGRRIDTGEHSSTSKPRQWRTRSDPLNAVWDSELVPLLEREPSLTGLTLLEYLDDHHPGDYQSSLLRTLQRRVKHWKALYGPAQDVIFRQQAECGLMGLSDFTHPDDAITVAGEPFPHLLYQFRFAYSGWRSVTAVRGGESYAALAEGLQQALHKAGGSPREHRTDSLSAAFNNRQNVWSNTYEAMCDHYGMRPSRNNPGISHENGAIECANGSFKRRLSQALKVRGSRRFASPADYQGFLDSVVDRLNRRVVTRFGEEQAALLALPAADFAAYSEVAVKVTRSSTIEVRHVLYTVPSQLIGHRLRIHLYHDRLQCYVAQSLAVTLPRVYPPPGASRARRVDYRHVIHALAAKPQAFRRAQLRDDILPDDNYRALWVLIDSQLDDRAACKWMVTVLRLVYDYDCEGTLGQELLQAAKRGQLPSRQQLQARFLPSKAHRHTQAPTTQHCLSSYDQLLMLNGEASMAVEVCHG